MSIRPIAAAALLALLCIDAHALKVGDAAPEFERVDISGKQVQLSKLRGRWVLLNFWATWCAPCREEMPAFSKWAQAFKSQGLSVVGVSMDDDVTDVKAFLGKYPVSYPIVMGDAKFADQFGGVLGLPLTYLIDPQGRTVERYQGEVELKQLEAMIVTRIRK